MEKYSYEKLWKTLGLLYIILIIYFSVKKVSALPGPSMLNDKALHGIVYAIGSYWFGLFKKRDHILFVFIFFSALGMVLEIIQGQLGYRYYDLEDQWANMFGSFLGCLITLIKRANIIKKIEQFLN